MSEAGPIIIERFVDAPPEKVWEALTDPDKLKQTQPFLKDFKPEVGFETRFELGRDDDHKYLHVLTVKEAMENQKLSYGWRYEGQAGDSRVSFELVPQNGGTRLTLTQTITEPFPADNPDFARQNFVDGWTWTIDAIKGVAEK